METSPNHLLNCFRVMFSRKTLLLKRLRVKRARFLRLLNVLFFSNLLIRILVEIGRFCNSNLDRKIFLVFLKRH